MILRGHVVNFTQGSVYKLCNTIRGCVENIFIKKQQNFDQLLKPLLMYF